MQTIASKTILKDTFFNAVQPRPSFEKYLGMSDINNFYLFKATEWQKYTVEGKIDIIEHVALPDGKKYIVGKLAFVAYDNSNLTAYQFDDGNFIIAN